MSTNYWTTFASPIGPLVVTADAGGVTGVLMDATGDWENGGPPGWRRDVAALAAVCHQLEDRKSVV